MSEDGAFVLLDFDDPPVQTLLELGTLYGIHDLAIEDAIEAHYQRPKLEVFGSLISLVAKSVEYDDASERLLFGELVVLASPSFLITIRHGTACGHPSTATMVAQHVERGNVGAANGATGALHAVIDYVADGFGPVMDDIELDLKEIEQDVFSPERTNPAQRIYRLKREVLSLRRNIGPLLPSVARLATDPRLVPSEEMRSYFRDVEDHVQLTVDRIEQADALLSDVLAANLAQIGVQQNADVRRMTAWAVLFLVPTLLAGVWGMNFAHMPELDWVLGYPIAVGSMMLATGTLWLRLKRANWL